jgi:FAD/FMN-containing dehydrogenase
MTPFRHMELDESRDILRVGAGARWSEILPYLDAHGRSVAVMQSNNSFTVGGSLSVNCHGWQYGRPPIASTVESFRLMQADGSIVPCSREENAELFSLALGGYGLFGIILEAELRVTPNVRYRLDRYLVPVDQSLATYTQRVLQTPGAEMVYARLNIVPDHFFEDVILNVFSQEPGEGPLPELAEPGLKRIRRAIFRGSAEDAYGKELRWLAETRLEPYLKDRTFSRNQLFNEGVEEFQNRSSETTDILHEYFVPPDRVITFLPQMREILLRRKANLLNVTVRHVQKDEDTFLRYADQEMFCFVMLFVQERTAAGEAEMEATTRELIDAALSHGGRYYLPYRLHATVDQFHSAYPQAAAFFRKKRTYDRDELFQNQFYLKYGQ